MKPENPIGAACQVCGKVPAISIVFYLDPDTFIGVFCCKCLADWLVEARRSERITKEQLTEIVMSEQFNLLLQTLEALKGDPN